MNHWTDQQLLREYAEHRSEPAFAELVRRHVDFTYSAALRMVRDAHLAEDVCQGVFATMAKDARILTIHPVIVGWLHRTARNLAAQVIRTESRRRAREEEAALMNESSLPQPDATWEQIAPHLDSVLAELNESERDAVLLRYFQRKSAREMAELLGTTEDAAQKRVSRAVESLRGLFSKRGLATSTGALALVISSHAVQAAPSAVAMSITNGVVAAAAMTQSATAAKALFMTTTQKTMIATAALLICGGAIVLSRTSTPKTGGVTSPATEAALTRLDEYIGRFEMQGHKMELEAKDKGLDVKIDGNPAFFALPGEKDVFVSHDHGSVTKLTFARDKSGKPTSFTLVRDGKTLGELKRI